MNRRWWSLLGSALIVAGVVWGILHVTQLKGGDQANASSYGQFLLAAIGLLIIVGGWLTKGFASTPEPTLDDLTNLLALATRNQAEKTAIERRLIQPAPLPIHWELATDPIAGPISTTHDGQAWFDPLPGLTHVTPGQLQGGDRATLHSVYGGLPNGRLIITGGPGAGKSSAAVLLQLDALRFREQAATDDDRRRIPVPVMFTLQGWDPDITSVEDWLVTKLVQIPLLAGRHGPRRARTLLRDKRVAVILDGFDEISEALGPHVLRALSDQSIFRVVLLGRRIELIEAAQKQILVGSVALQLKPLTSIATVEYLMQPLTEPAPGPWQRVATTISQDLTSPLARALNLPLWVSLLHDIYPPTGPFNRSVDELLGTARFPDPETITDHLLDQAVTAAYTSVPGRPAPRYTPDTARRTLVVIAKHLKSERDLAWWLIPTWIPRRTRDVLLSAVTAILFGLTGGVLVGFFYGFIDALAVVVGTAGGVWLASFAARPLGPWKTGRIVKNLRRPGAIFGLAVAAVLGLAIGIAVGRVTGLMFGLAVAFMIETWFVSEPVDIDEPNPVDPIELWRNELVAAFVQGAGLAAVGAVIVGLFAPVAGIAAGIGGVLGVSVVVGEAIRTSVCQIYLAMRNRIPLRLLRFLEDARARHLLRTVGPVYQFRHGTFQDRLRATSGVGSTPEVAREDAGRSVVGPS